jgi:NDP-sugar pyrophosphorylase family protein
MGTSGEPGADDNAASDCTVAIFCGGEGIRMEQLMRGHYAKTLLVAHDTPLLCRLLDQLRSAGFERIVASTTPRFERQITEAVYAYQDVRPSETVRIEVVVSKAQRRGVLVGLGELLDRIATTRCLTCLGDIFFLANPFLPFRNEIRAEHDSLGVATVAVEAELRQGGIVDQDDGKVCRIIERPMETLALAGQPVRWSGVALIDRTRALKDLEAFLTSAPADSPPGDFFEFQRARGRDFRCTAGPDFVNVNSPDHLLLASLYARLEKRAAAGDLSTALARSAASLRLFLAEQPRVTADALSG